MAPAFTVEFKSVPLRERMNWYFSSSSAVYRPNKFFGLAFRQVKDKGAYNMIKSVKGISPLE